MRVGLQDIAEKLILLLAHVSLGLFLSSLLGLLTYIVLLPIVQSIWDVRQIDFALMGVLAVGIGGGVGTFLGWFSRDFSRRELVFLLLLTVTATLIGAWIGLHSSRDAFKLVGRPGIPALTGIVVGAILSGNILRLCLWTISAARNPRI